MSNTVQSVSPKRAYPISEVATILSISRSSLYVRIKSGELRIVKCGRRTLVLASEIDRSLQNLEGGGV